MQMHTVEEIGAKMNALGLWKLLEPYNFAVNSAGAVPPDAWRILRKSSELSGDSPT